MQDTNANTSVCLFRSTEQLQTVVQELIHVGIPRTSIDVITNNPDARYADGSKHLGALKDLNVTKEDMQLLHNAVHQGGVVLCVRSDRENIERAEEIFGKYDSPEVNEHFSEKPPMSKTEDQIQTEAAVIPVIEEELVIDKRATERGGVRIHGRVREESVEQQVSLLEEHVTVDRRPVDRPASPDEVAAMKDESFEVTETVEEPTVKKRAKVVEEVVVGKETSERTAHVREKVRKAEVKVEQVPADPKAPPKKNKR